MEGTVAGSARKTAVFLALVLAFFALRAASSSAEVNGQRILSFISLDPSSSEKVGIAVRSVYTGEYLFSHNARKKFIPASNNKIVSSAAALTLLGKDFRFRTEFYAGEGLRDGVVRGGLYVKGYGDPTIDLETLRRIVGQIADLGVSSVEGGIFLDGSHFDDAEYAPGWDPGWVGKSFCPPVTAVSFSRSSAEIMISASMEGLPAQVRTEPEVFPFRVRNRVVAARKASDVTAKFDKRGELRVSGNVFPGREAETVGVSVPDPFFYFGDAMRRVLEKNGIEVGGFVLRGGVPARAEKIFTHFSEPLESVVREYNKESVNIIGESVTKALGAEFYGPPGSWEKGTRAIRKYLREAGVGSGATIVDGSGLSRLNRISAKQIVDVLVGAYRNPEISSEFFDSLSVAGADGTLKERFFAARGRIYAKTGYLRGARALSGYVFGTDGGVYAFSVISNGMGKRANALQTVLLGELVN